MSKNDPFLIKFELLPVNQYAQRLDLIDKIKAFFSKKVTLPVLQYTHRFDLIDENDRFWHFPIITNVNSHSDMLEKKSNLH